MNKINKGLFGLTGKAKESLIQKAIEKRSARDAQAEADTARRAPSGARVPVSDDLCRFDKLPGYKDLMVQRLAADQLNISNPFFRLHEGTASATSVIDGRECINFSSYNYLELSGHPRVSQAAKDAIDQYGTSVSASRPVSGERPVQQELEQALAALHGTEDAVVFVSGHATNVTSIGYLFGPRDLVLHDALIHNSVLQGIQLSGAFRLSFPHNDWQALERMLEQRRHEFERVLIVVEGIYSMDGDHPDLPKFIELKRRHRAFLMVDEAHSIGVMGERGHGIAEHYGVAGGAVDIWMGTLSKTMAGCGGYIAGEQALIDHLKFSAPGFLYSVGMPAPMAAASLEAIRVMQEEPQRVRQLCERSRYFLARAREQGLDTGLSRGYSVVPVLCGSSIKAVRLSNLLLEKGINVQPIVYPAVEEKLARLRFFISCAHTEAQIDATVAAIADALKQL
ncbi:aminotransferase class I/II-fold pyridoxal phosphate-dependent enzyme [Marinobacterium rhizophilum]|uniref:aminotransferase class I/II-fold pyridoxal phosphate-dependent enzyme n=1 Tax=Marinobacterium rhizophilum TaxID=420402 RepID=UPI00035FE0FF|nr:aminotransferase class I/II-fold pyridoxal phosphate-dependent enzyme [Marinobacterium rhizophilum]